jgi:DNA-binding protein YbaB
MYICQASTCPARAAPQDDHEIDHEISGRGKVRGRSRGRSAVWSRSRALTMVAVATDQWLTDFESTLAELRQKSEDLQEGLAAAEATATSGDGSVTVTVGPNGGLRNLRLGHRALEHGTAGLTALILETARAAQRQVTAKVRAAFEPLGGGTEAMTMYLDAVPDDLAEPPKEEAPPPPKPAEDDEDGKPW